MLKRLMISMVFLFAVSTISYSQEKFTVSGEINFHEQKGEILVWLKTHEEFEKKEPAPAPRSFVIKPSPQELEAKKVNFKFVDVPKGSYCIHVFQDLNMNGKLDYSPQTYIPVEPYGFSGTAYFGGAWDDIKFEVDKDISGIEISLPGV